jgi:hypothetical protein
MVRPCIPPCLRDYLKMPGPGTVPGLEHRNKKKGEPRSSPFLYSNWNSSLFLVVQRRKTLRQRTRLRKNILIEIRLRDRRLREHDSSLL